MRARLQGMRLAIVVLLAVGCGGANADAPDAAAPACAPIGGTAPFSVLLSGRGANADGGAVTAAVEVYFPRGRVAGADVVFSHRNYLGGWSSVSAVLDDTLSTGVVRVGDVFCRSGFEGRLVGPSGGLVGTAQVNTAAPSDAITMVTGSVTLCASGAVPEQKVEPLPSAISPLAPLIIRSARPFAPTSVAGVTARADAGPVAIDVVVAHPGLVVRPKGAAFPLFAPTTIDVSALRDVLGAPLGLSTVKTQTLSAVVTDRSFASAPPVGAQLGASTVGDGVLRVESEAEGEIAYALAVGSEAGKTRLRVRHRVACRAPSSGQWGLQIVGPDGASEPLARTCTAAFRDDVVELPGTGPFALVARRWSSEPSPCSYSGGAGNSTRWELDEITFE